MSYKNLELYHSAKSLFEGNLTNKMVEEEFCSSDTGYRIRDILFIWLHKFEWMTPVIKADILNLINKKVISPVGKPFSETNITEHYPDIETRKCIDIKWRLLWYQWLNWEINERFDITMIIQALMDIRLPDSVGVQNYETFITYKRDILSALQESVSETEAKEIYDSINRFLKRKLCV